MQQASVLDLAIFIQPPQRQPRRLLPVSSSVAMASAAVLLGLGAAVLVPSGALGIEAVMQALGLRNGDTVKPSSQDEMRRVLDMTVDDKAQLIVEGLDAQTRNAAIPVSGLPLEKAAGFILQPDAQAGYVRAMKCLTQAVYYEAAVEPIQGRRAVAQVVLNRMRHPAYPKSVCGVVYEGSQRRTGCQFSFTCDGSLLRAPAARPWREAEQVARAALAGYVESSVGTATHYHADYVLPKWAFQLAKVDRLGRHIFYRFTGNWGRANALSGRYSGIESIPSINFQALQDRLLADGKAVSEDGWVPGLTVAPHVSDRHAEADVGGRLDTTKQWRLNIPDPVQASSRYREAIGAVPVNAEQGLAKEPAMVGH